MSESQKSQPIADDSSTADKNTAYVGEVGVAFPPPPEEASSGGEGEDSRAGAVAGDTNPPEIGHHSDSQPQDRDEGWARYLALILLSALLGALLALLALVIINGSLDVSKHESLIFLRSQIDTLAGNVEAQGQQLADNTAALRQLQDELANGTSPANAESEAGGAEAQMQGLITETQDLEDSVKSLNERVKTLGGALGGMQVNVDLLDDDLQTFEAQTEALQTEVDQIDSQLAVIQDELAAIKARAGEVETTPPTPSPTAAVTPQPSAENTPSPAIIETQALPPGQIIASPALALFPSLTPISKPEPGQSHIIGLVWNDPDGDARPEAGEQPAPRVIVKLKDAEGNRLGAAVTSADGRFFFPNLDPGVYVLEEIDPEGFTSVTPNRITISTTADRVFEVNFADAN